RTMAEAEHKFSELKALNEWRRQYRTAIIGRIRSESLRQTDCRLLLETDFDENLAHFADGFACAAYRKSSKETRSICRMANRAVPRTWRGLMQCLIQLGMGVPRNERELRSIVT